MAPAGPTGHDDITVTEDRSSDEDTSRVDDPLARARTRLSDRARLVVAVMLSCALVVAIVVGILVSIQYADSRNATTAGGSRVDASLSDELKERGRVQTAAATFVANVNTYDSNNIEAFRQRLDGLLTPSFAQSNKVFVKSIVKTMKTTKLKSDGEVLRTAVAQIDDQSATALVIADAHATSVFGERVRHFRWKVSLVRDPDNADRWLVDDFEAVA